MTNSGKVVKTPFKNCTAKDPSACPYHSKRFTPHPLAKQFKVIEDVFVALDANKVKSTQTILKEKML